MADEIKTYNDDYLGYKEIAFSDEEAQILFPSDKNTYIPNDWGLLCNEYLIAKDNNDAIIGMYRCVGDTVEAIYPRTIQSNYMGQVKARNPQQVLAIDMLCREDITVKILTGRFGTGKDYLFASAAVSMLERGAIDKIVFVRNNVEVKNTKPIGYLPGDTKEKMLPWAGPLIDHLGGEDGLFRMMEDGKVEIAHLGFLRGRDIRRSIIYCTEAENLITQHVQLLLGRCAEGTQLWMNGDYKQADMDVFLHISGMMTAVSRLKGQPLFGYVQLQKTERSATAALADLLD